MAIFVQPRMTSASQSVQGKVPQNSGAILTNNPALNAQRLAVAQRKKAVNEYNAALEQYNKDLDAYNKAIAAQNAAGGVSDAESQDFARRVATGNISGSEFAQTKFAQDLKAKYGNAGQDVVQAAFYDYLLQFPNIDPKKFGAGNISDLRYARAVALQGAQEKLSLAQRKTLSNAQVVQAAKLASLQRQTVSSANKQGYVLTESGFQVKGAPISPLAPNQTFAPNGNILTYQNLNNKPVLTGVTALQRAGITKTPTPINYPNLMQNAAQANANYLNYQNPALRKR